MSFYDELKALSDNVKAAEQSEQDALSEYQFFSNLVPILESETTKAQSQYRQLAEQLAPKSQTVDCFARTYVTVPGEFQSICQQIDATFAELFSKQQSIDVCIAEIWDMKQFTEEDWLIKQLGKTRKMELCMNRFCDLLKKSRQLIEQLQLLPEPRCNERVLQLPWQHQCLCQAYADYKKQQHTLISTKISCNMAKLRYLHEKSYHTHAVRRLNDALNDVTITIQL